MGDLSAHFSSWEFACRGALHDGHPDHPLVLDGHLLEHLEDLRYVCGNKPLEILSGHRCTWWNDRVGGARYSQHVAGTAVDIPAGYASPAQAVEAGFTGIGEADGWAIHVDVRPIPARWSY